MPKIQKIAEIFFLTRIQNGYSAEERDSDGNIQESAYCKESGMEAMWLAKSEPKGLLARTEGWENNPALLKEGRRVQGSAHVDVHVPALIVRGFHLTQPISLSVYPRRILLVAVLDRHAGFNLVDAHSVIIRTQI